MTMLLDSSALFYIFWALWDGLLIGFSITLFPACFSQVITLFHLTAINFSVSLALFSVHSPFFTLLYCAQLPSYTYAQLISWPHMGMTSVIHTSCQALHTRRFTYQVLCFPIAQIGPINYIFTCSYWLGGVYKRAVGAGSLPLRKRDETWSGAILLLQLTLPSCTIWCPHLLL